MKKITKLILSVLFVTGVLASCSGATNSKNLNVTMALSESEWAVMKGDIIPLFEKNTGIKVNAVQVEATDVVKKLEAMKGAGKADIDLIAQDINNTSSLVAKGLVEDLSSYTQTIPKQTVGKLAEAGVFEGKTFFFPFRPNVEINYYNETKFNSYGLTPPNTWADLLTTSKTLKEKEGIGRVALKIKLSGDVIEIVEFIRSAGGDPLVLNDEGTIKAYEYLKELWPYLSENTLKASFSSTNGFLAKDEVYYAPNWPFGVNIIVKDGGRTDIKVTSGFTGPEKKIKTLGGDMLGIPIGAPNKEEALQFIEFLQTKEVQLMLLEKNGWPSMRDDVYGNVEPWQKPYFEATVEALKIAEPLPNVPYWGKINPLINDSLKEVVVDGKDVKETLNKYAQKIKEIKENELAQT